MILDNAQNAQQNEAIPPYDCFLQRVRFSAMSAQPDYGYSLFLAARENVHPVYEEGVIVDLLQGVGLDTFEFIPCPPPERLLLDESALSGKAQTAIRNFIHWLGKHEQSDPNSASPDEDYGLRFKDMLVVGRYDEGVGAPGNVLIKFCFPCKTRLWRTEELKQQAKMAVDITRGLQRPTIVILNGLPVDVLTNDKSSAIFRNYEMERDGEDWGITEPVCADRVAAELAALEARVKVLRAWMSNPEAAVIPPDTEVVDVFQGIFASQNGGFVSLVGEEPGEEGGLPDDMPQRFAEQSESLFD